jgi:hypothetical protein
MKRLFTACTAYLPLTLAIGSVFFAEVRRNTLWVAALLVFAVVPCLVYAAIHFEVRYALDTTVPLLLIAAVAYKTIRLVIRLRGQAAISRWALVTAVGLVVAPAASAVASHIVSFVFPPGEPHNIVEAALQGRSLVVRFDSKACHEFNLGTIQCDADYRVRYSNWAGGWEATGPQGKSMSEITATAGMALEPGVLSVWGLIAHFTNDGGLYYQDQEVGRVSRE